MSSAAFSAKVHARLRGWSRRATRAAVIAADRAGLPVDPYRVAGVPLREVEADDVCNVAMPLASVPSDIARAAQANRDRIAREAPAIIVRKYLERPVAPASVKVARIPAGRADFNGVIVSARGEAVSPDLLDHRPYFGNWGQAQPKGPTLRVEGTVAVLAHRFQRNYFHWMFDLLPRLAVLEEAGIAFDRVYVAQDHAFQRDVMRMMGYGPDRVIAANQDRRIAADELLAFSYWDAFNQVPAWACQFVRSRLVPTPTNNARRRIYISRADAATRHVRNQVALDSLLARHGVEAVTLGVMGAKEQMDMFASAALVVAPHGAALGNLVFCRPGTSVVELCPARYVQGCFFDLAQQCGLDFHVVPAAGMDCETDHGWSHQHDDIDVDLPALERLLMHFGDES